jgi:PAS domain S-box-containing protein
MSDSRNDTELVAALLAAALQAIPHPLLISDYETILWVNEPCRRLLGAAKVDDIYSRPALDFAHPDMHEAMAERKDVVLLRHQRMDDLPMKFLALDGSARPDTVSLVPIEFDGRTCALALFHSPSRICGIRDAASADSRDSAQDALIFEAIPTCMLLHDNTRILAANAACREFLGATSPEQLVGQPIESIVHRDGLESGVARRRMMSELGVDHLQRVPVKLRRVDGEEIRIRVDGFVLESDGQRGFLVAASMLGPDTDVAPRTARRRPSPAAS